jgi:hypothetical protein
VPVFGGKLEAKNLQFLYFESFYNKRTSGPDYLKKFKDLAVFMKEPAVFRRLFDWVLIF